jgi:hypothetical protein
MQGRYGRRASVAQAGLAGSRSMLRRGVQHDRSTPNRATASHAERGLWSACALLLSQDCLWCRAIPIPTGRALRVGDALEPLPCATLGAGMPRGMVHRDQLRGRSRRLMRGHREQDAPLRTSGISVDLSGTRRCRVRWSPSTARVPPHERAAWRLVWDGLAADRRLVSPNPRGPRPAAPPPRLW